MRRSWREPDSRPARGLEMEPSARQPVRAGSAAATGAGGGGPAPTHEAGVCVDPKRGPAGGNATGESGENPGNSGSMVDHVLAHGFAGAEGVCPAEHGDAADVEPGLADDAVNGTVVAADGENTATCGEGLQVAELGENRENNTSEANFRENVITIQIPGDLGVTAELAVDVGLDSGVDRHVVSPDLVCPDSGREAGEAAITVDGSGSQTPATVDGSGSQTPATVDGSGSQTPATVDGSGSQTPATVLDRRVVSPELVGPDSGREAAITVDGSGSQTPATTLDRLEEGVDGPGSQTPATVLDQPEEGAAEVGSGLADDAVDGTVVAADGENTATWGEGLQVVELGENRENDTNEVNFRENVITIQTPEDLGVTAKLAVGAGLDSGVDRHVLSPDLVCPDTGREAGEAAVSGVSGARAEEGPQADPVAEQKVVVGERRRDRRGDGTPVQPSKTERKRLRWEMARREMERRRVARQKERESRCDERLGGVDSTVPGVGAVRCEEDVRAP